MPCGALRAGYVYTAPLLPPCRAAARCAVAVWTRELIEAAIAQEGTYYLPYQAHATPEQFHRAYPRARELLALKRRLDPENRFRHVLWNTYAPSL